MVTEFFAEQPTSRGVSPGGLLAAVLGISLLCCGIYFTPFLWRRGRLDILVSFWALLVVIVVNIPRIIRDRIEAHRGKAMVRIDERGIWLRSWESLGWIDWADIQGVKLDVGEYEQLLWVTIRGVEKYLQRTTWIDEAAATANRALALAAPLLTGGNSDADGFTIELASSRSMGAQWGRLIDTLDPILMRHGIPMRQSCLGSSEPRPTSLGIVDTKPSVLVAQFPNGGPTLRAMIAKLVKIDATMADEVVALARAANPAQQASIGAGLAEASDFFTGLEKLAWTREADAQIRRAMDSADEGTRTGWESVKPLTRAPSPVG